MIRYIGLKNTSVSVLGSIRFIGSQTREALAQSLQRAAWSYRRSRVKRDGISKIQVKEGSIQLPHLAVRFQPLVVRVFNDLHRKESMQGSYPELLRTYGALTEHINLLSKDIAGGKKRTALTSKHIEQEQQSVTADLKGLLTRPDDVQKLDYTDWSHLSTCLSILKPHDFHMWQLLDLALAKSIQRDVQLLSGLTQKGSGDQVSSTQTASQVLDSILLRAHCLKHSIQSDTGISSHTNVRESQATRRSRASNEMRQTATEVGLALHALQSRGILEALLRAPYSWVNKASLEREETESSKSSLKQVNDASLGSETPYVSPFAGVHSRNKSWAPQTYDVATTQANNPLPSLERITLCLDVLDWARGKAQQPDDKALKYLNSVVAYNAWYEQARVCTSEGVHVPLHTLLYAWEALSNMPANNRALSSDVDKHYLVGNAAAGAEKAVEPVKDTSAAAIAEGSAMDKLGNMFESLSKKSTIENKLNVKASALPMEGKAVNKLILFQTIYTLVGKSLSTAPHQLNIGRSKGHIDLSILQSLFRTMLSTGVKSGELIKTIGDICERNDFFRLVESKTLLLFNQLVLLNEKTIAMKVLEQFHQNNNLDERGWIPYGAKHKDAGLSNDSLHVLWRELDRKMTGTQEPITAADLTLTLSVFSRVPEQLNLSNAGSSMTISKPQSTKDADNKFANILQTVEVKAAQQLGEQSRGVYAGAPWSTQECIQALNCYGQVGRRYPTVLDLLNRIIGDAFLQGKPMSSMEMQSVLWANSRLNHRPPFLKAMANTALEPYLKHADVISRMPDRARHLHATSPELQHVNFKSLVTLLWSLSVLECLDAEVYNRIGPILNTILLQVTGNTQSVKGKVTTTTPMKSDKKGPIFEGFMRTALDQISLDQQFVQGTFRKSGMRNDIDNHLYSNKSVKVITSHMHSDVSAAFHRMGISHLNEHVLNNGYTADIFIKAESDFSNFVYTHDHASLDYRKHSESLGTVVEIDGPGHFETYMMRPLGSTVMKHRHIRLSGYNFICIPFWMWNTNMSYEEKKLILVNQLRQSCFIEGKTKNSV